LAGNDEYGQVSNPTKMPGNFTSSLLLLVISWAYFGRLLVITATNAELPPGSMIFIDARMY
jgi:hypothetical protein